MYVNSQKLSLALLRRRKRLSTFPNVSFKYKSDSMRGTSISNRFNAWRLYLVVKCYSSSLGDPVNWRFLYGYIITQGRVEVNPEQADIVRMIYGLYLNGFGYTRIIKELEERRVPCYFGGKCSTKQCCFSSRIVCGECGCAYGSKLWHSTDKYRRTVWQCNAKFINEKKCSTPHLYEANIKAMFIEAFNSFFTCRNEILSAYSGIIKELTDNTALEKEAADLRAERDVVLELMRQCVRENSSAGLDQREYRDKYDALIHRHETAKTRLGEIDSLIKARKTKLKNIEMFMQTLKARDSLLTEFNEGVFIAVIESITVFTGKEVLIKFKDGTELPWTIK